MSAIRYPEESEATTALVLGVLSLFVPLLAPFAWYYGAREVNAIDANRRDPASAGLNGTYRAGSKQPPTPSAVANGLSQWALDTAGYRALSDPLVSSTESPRATSRTALMNIEAGSKICPRNMYCRNPSEAITTFSS